MAEKMTLSPGQRQAINALAAGQDYPKAAKSAGCSIRTLQRWRKMPAFVAALREADAEHLSGLARALNAAGVEALEVMITIMRDKTAPPGVRLRAADNILAHRREFYEQLNLSERLAALEEKVNNNA